MIHNINYYVTAINNIAEEDLLPIAELMVEAMDLSKLKKIDKRKKRYRDYKKCVSTFADRIIEMRKKYNIDEY